MADKKRDEEQKKAEQQKNKAAGGRTAWETESGTEPEDSFVRERVLNRMESRRRRMRRAGLLVASAVVFGAVSCMVFVLLKPHAEQWFAKKEPETPIYVPRDEASETTEASTETEAPETISSEEDLKDAVESAVESYQWSVSDYQNLYRALNNVSGEANQGIVTVTTRTQTADADWFDNPIETEGKKSGLVWNITDSEVLILTAYRAQENETTVEVTFSGGERAAAVMKAADAHTGIAIVSVPLSDLAETVRGRLRAVPLGNSIDARACQPVIVVGSPKDYVGSVAYGMLTYIRSGVQKEDMEVRLLCTDVSTGDGASGFVLNMDGAVIGMITDETTGTNTSAVGISGLKAAIERLSNGGGMAYVGIIGQDVTPDISEQHKIPRGVYVSDVTLEGPAYNSGIQNGDVITEVDGEEVLTVKMFQGCLETKNPGQDVIIKAQRAGRDGYTQLEFSVHLGTR